MAHEKQETFPVARMRLHEELGKIGWKLSKPNLKVLWAEPPGGEFRLWFKAQAVYLNDHSLFIEMRGLTVAQLREAAAERLTSDARLKQQYGS